MTTSISMLPPMVCRTASGTIGNSVFSTFLEGLRFLPREDVSSDGTQETVGQICTLHDIRNGRLAAKQQINAHNPAIF
jgi:hypothetical protein